jgi:hypothetical protein
MFTNPSRILKSLSAPEQSMDRRRSTRVPVDRPGTIIVPGGDSIPCRIVDLSESGAKLRPAWKGWVPDAFDLHDMFSGVRRAC